MATEGKTKKIALCALFVALHIVGGFIRIPMPFAPITLQAQIALIAGVLLGAKWGGLSVLLYLLLGLLGLPIFSGGGGFSYVLQPTFGYLLGFVVAAFVSGGIARSGTITYRRLGASYAAGVLLIYLLGTTYALGILTLYLHKTVHFGEFMLAFLLIPLPKDILLTVLVLPLSKRLSAYVLP